MTLLLVFAAVVDDVAVATATDINNNAVNATDDAIDATAYVASAAAATATVAVATDDVVAFAADSATYLPILVQLLT